MAALTKDRATPQRESKIYSDPVYAGAKIYTGALVMVDENGFARPAASGFTAGRPRGVAVVGVDNTTGADGAVSVETRPGVFRFKNEPTDLVDRTCITTPCRAVDDQTVSKSDGGGTRAIAGKVLDIDAEGVWVQIG